MALCKFQFYIFCGFVGCVIFAHLNSLVSAVPVISSEVDALVYLRKYGYLDEPNRSSLGVDSLISPKTVRTAIKEFQTFYGLSETGELDNTTLTLMNKPRCGVKDITRPPGPQRNALLVSKWHQKDLTYRISKYPRRLRDKQEVDKVIAKAFKLWSDVTNLNFIRVDRRPVSIDIRFEVGKHCPADPFDGPERTLAHAFYPQVGDAHFDDQEWWTLNENYGKNLLQVAVHEFGHSLGLSHSNIADSAMYSYYRGYQPTFRLHKEDIEKIQSLYGSARKKERTATKPTPAKPFPEVIPDLCRNASIDAATTTADGRSYLFKGNFYWEVKEDGLVDRHPRKISDDWEGLQGNLDAAVTWSNGPTFFFKKDTYWKFFNKELSYGYPRLISDGFEEIPDNIDAAFSFEMKTYFFKGSQYWRYDPDSDTPVSYFYPQPISKWEVLPDSIDAVLPWQDKTYFFKGDSYYRIDNELGSIDQVDPPYPRSTATWWFGC